MAIIGNPIIAAVKSEVDSVFNEYSENPVQNRVIAAYVREPSLTLDQDEETKLVYVATQDGVRLGNGILVEGTGGGGGGGNDSYNAKVTNLLDSRTFTVPEGGSAVIAFRYTSVDADGEDDGPGVGVISVNGVQRQTLSVSQGDHSIDISPLLSAGENRVIIRVTNSVGRASQMQYTIAVVALKLTTTYADLSTYSGDEIYSYTVSGIGEKTMHFVMDGEDMGLVTVTTTGRSQSFTIPVQAYGGHVFECYATMDVDGMPLKSNVLRHGMIWLKEGVTNAAITSTFNQKTAIQGETLSIPYLAYDPLQAEAEVELIVIDSDGNQYSSSTIRHNRTPDVWTLTDYPAGEITIRLRCGSARCDFYVDVEAYELPVSSVTDGLMLEFSAAGRSNGEANPAQWSYNDIEASFTNFGWGGADGWVADSDGTTVLRFLPGDTMEIPFYSFRNNITSSGYTVEIEMATHNVRDYESVVISCMSGGHGFVIRSQSADLSSEQSGVSVQFREDARVRVAFSIESLNLNRLIYIYVNGIMCGVAQYPSADNFRQITPADILIGAQSCGIDLYKIRIYNKGLTSTEQLDNFIADRSTLAERREAYERNDILDENENVTIDRLPNWLSHILIRCPRLPASKEEDDATAELEFVDPLHPDRSWTATGVKVGIQGTSSAGYPIKNWKFKLKKGIVYETRDSQGNERTDVGFPIHEGEIPTKTICWKADFASSENANNVVLAMYYNDLCPYKTPAQQANPKVRQGIDGFASTLFWMDTTTNEVHFLGKGNCNVDKGNDDIFGLTEEYPDAESWEFLNNTSNRSLFSGADFESMGTDKNGNPIKAWQNDFEARYPDDSLDIERWAAAVAWVASTDRNAVSTEAEKNARLQKFRNEFEDHFILEALLFYYVFTETFLLMDNRAKNMFMTTFDGVHWFTFPYDFDSSLGINNEGSLAFGYWLEDTDFVDGKEVYTGQKSVLWNNFRDAFQDEIREMYRSLRSMSDNDPSKESPFSYYRAAKRFTDHQSAWPEALWNEDAYTKYLQPYFTTGEDYLDRLYGSKASQRDWWLYNRFGYLDSKYFCGEAATNRIVLRTNRIADMTIIPYADIYGHVRFGSYDTVKRCKRNVEYTLECHADNLDDTETYIYSANRLRSVGDLSPLLVGEWNSAAATKLQEIKLGDSDPNYDNPLLGAKNSVNVGTNELLTSIDVTNCSGFGTGNQKTLDVSKCPSLQTVLASGTALQGVLLPNGGHLRTLKLPGTIKNFTIQNQKELQTLTFDRQGTIQTLVVENCPTVPVAELLLNNPVANFRLINFEITVTAAQLQTIYDKLAAESAKGIEPDLKTETAVGNSVSGVINVNQSVSANLIAAFGDLCPEVLIVVNGQASCVVRFRDWDGTVLNIQNISRGGTAVDPVAEELIEVPVRPDSERIRYTYDGWDKPLTNIQTHTVITAKYAEESAWYAIFQNWDGTELYRELVLTGEAAEDPEANHTINTPVRPSDGTFSYTYVGWDRSLLNFRSDRIITAKYATSASLTVTFQNWDGTELWVANCKMGGSVEDPVAAGYIDTPTRPDDDENQRQYAYMGWNRDLRNITDNMVVTPTYSIVSYYKATFLNYDSSVLYIEKLRYRMAVTDPVEAEYIQTPARPPEATYAYIYKGWDKALTTSIGSNVTYTAQYKTNQEFEVTFVNTDGEVLHTQYVYDEDDAVDPVESGIIATPTIAPTDQYVYTYNGWNTSLTNIKAPRTITAKYKSTIRKWRIRFLNDDGSVNTDLGELNYGTTLKKPATPAHSSGDPKYEFLFWDPDETTVTKDRDYIAVFRDNTIELVRYLDGSMTEYTRDNDTKIAPYAFYAEPNLESVTSNASSIGDYAFYQNAKLKTVDLTNTGAVSIGTYVFTEDKLLDTIKLHGASVASLDSYRTFLNTKIGAGFGTLYVPDALVDSYKAHGTWSMLKYEIFPISQYPLINPWLITDSWADIFAAEDNGTYKTKYSVGQMIPLTVGSNTVYMQIAGFDKDVLASGGGNAKITWLLRCPYFTRRYGEQNYIAIYGWTESDGVWTSANGNQSSGYTTGICTWTVNVSSAGTFVIEYSSTAAGYGNLTISVNGSNVLTNYSASTDWRTISRNCAAGDTLTIVATYNRYYYGSNGNASIRFSGTASVRTTASPAAYHALSWADFELPEYLDTTILPQIDQEVRARILPVTKVSRCGRTGTDVVTTNTMWIPSVRELNMTGYESSGAIYDELFASGASCIRHNTSYNVCTYAVRSTYSAGVRSINEAGNINGSSYNSPTAAYYILYGFCT